VEWDGSSGGWEVQGGVDRCLCFWTACWLPEGAISSFAPSLATRARGRSVHEALQGDNGYVTSQELFQLRCSVIMSFGKGLSKSRYSPRQPTKFVWRWTNEGIYSASSAYRAFFEGTSFMPGAKELWRAQAPPKVKFSSG
jgi:hypothetical protein